MSEEVKQIISAYVLGCLDNKNLSQFVDYVRKGGKETEGQLGELQNIISLIPTLLIEESVPEFVKDEIAQKILEDEFETKEIKSKKINEVTEPIRLETQPLYTNTVKTTTIEKEEKKPRKGIFFYLILVALILLLSAWGIFSYLTINDSRIKNSTLTQKVNRLSNELNELKKVNNENDLLVQFMTNKEIKSVDFWSTDTTGASGKMLISFKNGEAILTLNINGEISSDEYLKLWAVLKRSELFLGEINFNPLKKFYKIEKIPAVSPSEIKLFSITIEKRRIVEILPKRILLNGKFN